MKRLLLLLHFSLLIVAAGCAFGPNYASTTLRGKVTVDGVPIEDGLISITPNGNGGQGTGVRVTITKGEYTAKAVPVGKCRVSFTAVKKTGKKVKGMFDKEVDEAVSLIPARYSEGLETEIERGQKTLDFALESGQATTRPNSVPGVRAR
ncbi:MAG: hypothetical protein ACRC46_00155 [Thermoguttaceae bacterium]